MSTRKVASSALLLLAVATVRALPGEDDKWFTIGADFLAAHPLPKDVTCSQAVRFEKDILALGNVGGNKIRSAYFAKWPIVKAETLQQVRRIGVDREMNEVLDEAEAQIRAMFAHGFALVGRVYAQFDDLHRRSAAALTKTTGQRKVGERLLAIFAQLSADVDALIAHEKDHLDRSLKHLRQVSNVLLATLQERNEYASVLHYGVGSMWRVQVLHWNDILEHLSSRGYELHRASDVKVEALLAEIRCPVPIWRWKR